MYRIWAVDKTLYTIEETFKKNLNHNISREFPHYKKKPFCNVRHKKHNRGIPKIYETLLGVEDTKSNAIYFQNRFTRHECQTLIPNMPQT